MRQTASPAPSRCGSLIRRVTSEPPKCSRIVLLSRIGAYCSGRQIEPASKPSTCAGKRWPPMLTSTSIINTDNPHSLLEVGPGGNQRARGPSPARDIRRSKIAQAESYRTFEHAA